MIETSLFPYENYLYRLSFRDKKNTTVCWFESEEHRKSHIKRYNLKAKDIVTQNG
jgi:hypothetical protein